jgi:uncharacterized protein (DUF1697 family)
MIKYAAFLRGINVGGHHIVKMEELRRIFAALGFENVKTYIQSGNVIFETAETDADFLAEKIERELKQAFGFEVKTMPRTIAEVEEIAARNPFRQPETGAKIYVCLLSAAPAADLKDSLAAFENDFEVFRLRNRELYWMIRPHNTRKELFSNNFIEKHLKVAATTRNITTINKMLLLK